ncbi:hypothetical protein D0469_18175 [Peribacillus saganii]|uniref:Uncharacterized protein n=1 Tax=Peribacillus saganii TaxID=2303992 RepID=A0A372LE37_9BACI|nr:hypothetical protein [Peribacillus saganii]RFU64487.1 hypothetical protein D0469_18175 [Peribacillus saganii]
MKKQLNKLVNKAKKSYNHATANIKEKLYDMSDTPYATVQQLADYIQQHPESISSTREFLGTRYHFYQLETDQNLYYLETKGSKILQLDVISQNTEVVSYRSYRDKYTIKTPIKIAGLI